MSHTANLRASQRAQEVPSSKTSFSQASTKFVAGGENGITKGSEAHKFSAAPPQNVKALKQRNQDNSTAKFEHADTNDSGTKHSPEILEISSDEPDEEEDEDENNGEVEYAKEGINGDSLVRQQPVTGANGASLHKPESTEEQAQAGQSETEAKHSQPVEDEEIPFGDLLRARGGETVDFAAQEDDEDPGDAASSHVHRPPLPAPNANSLGTVLTQALRTNDTPLLESCLHVGNLQSIRATIERLPSPQAGTLLQKLAERMYKRPGRAGSLMVWIQWTIVAHGGYLATQPHVMNELKELYRVVKQRASALQPLLALKGKLDMLEAQLQLRRSRMAGDSQAESDEDGALIYVEPESGEEEDEEDEELSEAEGIDQAQPPKTAHASKASLHRDLTFESEEEDDDTPMVNGDDGDRYVNDYSGEEDDDDEDQDVIDDEAESTDSDGEEDLSDEGIDFEDVDEHKESSSEGDEDEPAPKRSKPSR